MSTTAYFFGITAALTLLVVVLIMLRQRRLRERHALWWLIFVAINLIAAVFPSLLETTSRAIGIEIPANLIFFVGIMVLFLISVQQSSEITELAERTRTLAEEVGLQRVYLEELARECNCLSLHNPSSEVSSDSTADILKDEEE